LAIVALSLAPTIWELYRARRANAQKNKSTRPAEPVDLRSK
jgi:hypothetical protein